MPLYDPTPVGTIHYLVTKLRDDRAGRNPGAPRPDQVAELERFMDLLEVDLWRAAGGDEERLAGMIDGRFPLGGRETARYRRQVIADAVAAADLNPAVSAPAERLFASIVDALFERMSRGEGDGDLARDWTVDSWVLRNGQQTRTVSTTDVARALRLLEVSEQKGYYLEGSFAHLLRIDRPGVRLAHLFNKPSLAAHGPDGYYTGGRSLGIGLRTDTFFVECKVGESASKSVLGDIRDALTERRLPHSREGYRALMIERTRKLYPDIEIREAPATVLASLSYTIGKERFVPKDVATYFDATLCFDAFGHIIE